MTAPIPPPDPLRAQPIHIDEVWTVAELADDRNIMLTNKQRAAIRAVLANREALAAQLAALAVPAVSQEPPLNLRPAIFDPEHYPEDRLAQLLNATKDSRTIHYDEDTIPHGACDDPIHCDCMCPLCWTLKADIVRAGLSAAVTREHTHEETETNDRESPEADRTSGAEGARTGSTGGDALPPRADADRRDTEAELVHLAAENAFELDRLAQETPRLFRQLAQIIGSRDLFYQEPEGDWMQAFTARERRRMANKLNEAAAVTPAPAPDGAKRQIRVLVCKRCGCTIGAGL